MKFQAQTQQTKSFGVIINGDMQKSSLERETAGNIWLKSSLKQIFVYNYYLFINFIFIHLISLFIMIILF